MIKYTDAWYKLIYVTRHIKTSNLSHVLNDTKHIQISQDNEYIGNVNLEDITVEIQKK